MLAALRERPDLFGLDERELSSKLRSENRGISATDNRLRLKFWDEYERAHREDVGMTMYQVFGGICTAEFFYDSYGKRPEKIAWLLCPPTSYMVKMEEALAFGLEQLRDMLELPNTDSKGRLNLKLMELKAKIVEMVDRRVKGAVVQRVEQKNMNLHISTTESQVHKMGMSSSMDSINKRIKELEKKDRQALETIRVESQRLGDESDE
jgi:hypothetical protein